MDAEQFLSNVGLFHSLDKKHIKRLARAVQSQRYAPGATIVKQGDSGLGLYVIASGAVDIRKERPGQEDLVVNTLGPGGFFGEMALLDDYPRSATVVAREETECLTLAKWHFLGELEAHPEMALPMLSVMSRRVRDALELAEARA
jgi:CRP/FNR family transcriptional regulator